MMRSLETEIRERFLELYPTEAVQTLERCTHEEVLAELADVESRQAMFEVLDRVSSIRTTEIFKDLPENVQKWILQSAPPSLLIRILYEVDDDEKEPLLDLLEPSDRKEIERLLEFPIDSAAALMDSVVGSIRQGMSVGEALERIELESDRSESVVFVVNDENELVGRVFMQDLALARNHEPLLDYTQDVEMTVNVSMTGSALADEMEGNREDSVPVIDENNRLLGVVHADALRDLVEGDATADLQRMVGASVDERALTNPTKAIFQRLPWLLVNLATAFLAASVVGLFENIIAMFTALAVLLPVVAGQSGNSGSQAMAVAIRGLALREIGVRDWYRIAWKEPSCRNRQWLGDCGGLRCLRVFLERLVGVGIDYFQRNDRGNHSLWNRWCVGSCVFDTSRSRSGYGIVYHPHHSYGCSQFFRVFGHCDALGIFDLVYLLRSLLDQSFKQFRVVFPFLPRLREYCVNKRRGSRCKGLSPNIGGILSG